ncbi:MAG: hypothetical protein C0420_02775, partial [Methylobacterium sp.]|nr:hypothetical protein [Methylobacterium sp.]
MSTGSPAGPCSTRTGSRRGSTNSRPGRPNSNRQSLVTALADTLQAGGIVPGSKAAPLRPRLIKPEEPIRASGVTSFAPIMPTKPTPAPDAPGLRGAGDTQDPWRSGKAEPQPPAQRVETALTRLDRALANTAGAQLAALRDMDETLQESQKRLRGALSETGLDTDRLAAQSSVAKGVGGPFVPLKIDPAAGPFEATLS